MIDTAQSIVIINIMCWSAIVVKFKQRTSGNNNRCQLLRTCTHLGVIQHPQLIQPFFRCHSAASEVVVHGLIFISFTQPWTRCSKPCVRVKLSPKGRGTSHAPVNHPRANPQAPNESLDAQSCQSDAKATHLPPQKKGERSMPRLWKLERKCVEIQSRRNTHVRI